MKFLGLRVFTKNGYHERLRDEEKNGFKVALSEFSDANEVHFGTPTISGNNFNDSKVVVLGDGVCLFHNVFTSEGHSVEVK